jgi:hypothetical protein
VNDQVADWIEEKADSRATTKGRIVEELLRDAYQEQGEGGSNDEESLPEGVYVPDSDKHDYALKYRDVYNGGVRRDYYKTREGVTNKRASVKESDQFAVVSV